MTPSRTCRRHWTALVPPGWIAHAPLGHRAVVSTTTSQTAILVPTRRAHVSAAHATSLPCATRARAPRSSPTPTGATPSALLALHPPQLPRGGPLLLIQRSVPPVHARRLRPPVTGPRTDDSTHLRLDCLSARASATRASLALLDAASSHARHLKDQQSIKRLQAISAVCPAGSLEAARA